jgi:biopolymer transport protein ExbD
MKYKISFLIISIILVLMACTNSHQSGNSDIDTTTVKEVYEQHVITIDSNVIKVYIDKTGLITANGNPVSLTTLDSSFSNLKKRNGTVYYSRDNTQATVPDESIKVIDLVTKYRLPIKFYKDKSFNRSCKNEFFCG